MKTNGASTSRRSSRTKRIVNVGSGKRNLVCNSQEQPLKRVRKLGGNNGEVINETRSLSQPIRNRSKEAGLPTATPKTISNEVEGSLCRSSVSPVKAMLHKESSLADGFSNHKKAGVFAVGQYLAIYDREKMPRLYARIDRIESCYKKETNSMENKLYVRWLRPAPINPDEKKWHAAGLTVSCGFFKLDKCRLGAGSRPVISHLVSSFQEYHYSKDLFELYPREGEVWALYKEWKPFEWCSDPRRRKGCKFQFVEILSDYSTETGVKVAFLEKVAGYETIFRRSSLSCQIAARNLFGFSHNVPVRLAAGEMGAFAGKLFKLDPLPIPGDVAVDTVEAEFSHGSSINHQCPGSHPITSQLDLKICTMNQSALDVALSSEDQCVKQLNTTSLRLVSPRTCEENKCQADGTSKDENTSSKHSEMDGSSKEKVGNLTVTKDRDVVAEKIDSESDAVSLGVFILNESECGNNLGDSDDALNKLYDNEKVAEEIDSKINGDSFGGFMVNEAESGNSSSDSGDAVNKLDDEENMAEEVDSKIDGVSLGGFMVNESKGENSSRNKDKESKWQIEDDMLSSLEQDPVLCMKAVCALHRQELTKGKSVTGSLHTSNGRFSFFSKFEPVIRGREMAEFLTDNNPQGDLKKSVKELDTFMPEGLEDCKTLAIFYLRELFTIYQNHKDPFFGPC